MLSLLCILCAGAWPVAVVALALYALSLQPKRSEPSVLPMLFLFVALLSFSACAAEERATRIDDPTLCADAFTSADFRADCLGKLVGVGGGS